MPEFTEIVLVCRKLEVNISDLPMLVMLRVETTRSSQYCSQYDNINQPMSFICKVNKIHDLLCFLFLLLGHFLNFNMKVVSLLH